jgi:hypothetical protein
MQTARATYPENFEFSSCVIGITSVTIVHVQFLLSVYVIVSSATAKEFEVTEEIV